jgi:hypothetical protein
MEAVMPRTWKFDQARRSARTRLGFERLEDRTLLAVAAFQIDLFEDVDGSRGDRITDDAVEVGDTFFVEILARELDPVLAGLRSVSLDMAWDPDVLEVVDSSLELNEVITTDLPLFRDGTLDNDAGTIENLSAGAMLSSGAGRAIGNYFPERFALLHFRALAAVDDSPLLLRQGRSAITTVPVSSLRNADLDFETQTITVFEPSAMAISPGLRSSGLEVRSPAAREIPDDPPESEPESGVAARSVIPSSVEASPSDQAPDMDAQGGDAAESLTSDPAADSSAPAAVQANLLPSPTQEIVGWAGTPGPAISLCFVVPTPAYPAGLASNEYPATSQRPLPPSNGDMQIRCQTVVLRDPPQEPIPPVLRQPQRPELVSLAVGGPVRAAIRDTSLQRDSSSIEPQQGPPVDALPRSQPVANRFTERASAAFSQMRSADRFWATYEPGEFAPWANRTRPLACRLSSASLGASSATP